MWTCPKCGREFANLNQEHSCVRVAVAEHFRGRPAGIRRLYDAFARAVRRNGPVRIEATKTRIGFHVAMIFAAITPRNSELRGHLVLARRVDDERFLRIDSISPRNHVHHFALRSAEQIDERFCELIAEACAVGRQEHLGRKPAGYSPPPSVWDGEDAALIERMLRFYPRRPPERILDATVNDGRFWRGSKRAVVGVDLDRRHRPDVQADNTRLPFSDAAFDVVVYDPPHVPNQGRDNAKDFRARFGLAGRSAKETAYTFAYTYPPFVSEAYRVLKPEGLLLAKIADYVHHHRYNWAHIDFIEAARQAGFRACDCIVKIRKGPIIDPKWKTAHHSRRQHCYWLVFRKSTKCE